MGPLSHIWKVPQDIRNLTSEAVQVPVPNDVISRTGVTIKNICSSPNIWEIGPKRKYVDIYHYETDQRINLKVCVCCSLFFSPNNSPSKTKKNAFHFI